MKKFLKIVGSILVVVLLVVAVIGSTGGTKAWFFSAVSSTNNSVAAGRLKLTVNGSDNTTQLYTVSNLKPGDWAYANGQATLKNEGTMPGQLWYEIVDVTPSDGALGNLVYPQFQANAANNYNRYNSGLTFNQAVGVRVNVVVLGPGETLPMVAYVSWPPSSNDNSGMGLMFNYGVIWHLDQIH